MAYEDDFDRVGAMLKQSSMGLPLHPLRVEMNAKKQMPYKQSPRSKSSNFSMPKLPTLPVGMLLNVAIVGAVALVGYKLYSKFFGGTSMSDLIADKNDKGTKALGSTYISSQQSQADTITNNANALANKGLTVSQNHKNIANTIQGWLNSLWVDHDIIVKTILAENIQTFRLVSVAYGTRSLPVYASSPAHIANVGLSGLLTIFGKEDIFTGTLKDHLVAILTDSEKKKLSAYLAVI